MKLLKLKEQIAAIEETCELFLHVDEEEHEKIEENMVLKIKVFEDIIRECKEEIESSDMDHKVHVLKLLYDIEFEEGSERLDDSLESYMNKQTDVQHIETGEKEINVLKSLILHIDDIVEKLAVEYKTLLYATRKWYRFKDSRLKEYANFLIRLMSLKEKLEIKLENDSKKISILIIDNFYSLYIFFSFLISLSIVKKREMLLIEIANRLDRYMEIVKSSFKDRSLYQSDMVHYYIIYELKELKEQIFTELAPR
ncbi:MAG: hypothetical protein JJW00_09425 [Sulfurimonas sp.]|nr:hypothetical protein [Sulfurimonas sp.]